MERSEARAYIFLTTLQSRPEWLGAVLARTSWKLARSIFRTGQTVQMKSDVTVSLEVYMMYQGVSGQCFVSLLIYYKSAAAFKTYSQRKWRQNSTLKIFVVVSKTVVKIWGNLKTAVQELSTQPQDLFEYFDECGLSADLHDFKVIYFLQNAHIRNPRMTK